MGNYWKMNEFSADQGNLDFDPYISLILGSEAGRPSSMSEHSLNLCTQCTVSTVGHNSLTPAPCHCRGPPCSTGWINRVGLTVLLSARVVTGTCHWRSSRPAIIGFSRLHDF